MSPVSVGSRSPLVYMPGIKLGTTFSTPVFGNRESAPTTTVILSSGMRLSR